MHLLSLTMHQPGQCCPSAATTPVARPWNLRSARKTPGRIDTSTVVNVAACYPPTMQSAALPTASACAPRRPPNSAVSGLRPSTNPRVLPILPPSTVLQPRPTPSVAPFIPRFNATPALHLIPTLSRISLRRPMEMSFNRWVYRLG